jgi:Na+-driven multidrug efflux pump
MNGNAHNGCFWVYIVLSVIFLGIAIYFVPKFIRFLDESADRFVEKKVKKRDDDEDRESL